MDRNQVIGFSLIAVILIAYVGYNQHSQKVYEAQKVADSVAYVKAHPRPVVDSSNTTQQVAAAAAVNDSLCKTMPPAYSGTDQFITLENKKLSLQFTSKGAYPVSAQIKDYKTYSQKPLYLFDGSNNYLSFVLPVNNGSVATSDLYFTPVTRDEPNGDKTIDFSADLGAGKKVDIIYTLPADDYMMRCSVHLTGMPMSGLPVNWQTFALHTEKDVSLEKLNSQIYYQYKNGDHDYFSIRDNQRKSLDNGSVAWIGFRKQYFSTVLLADDGFNKTDVTVSPKNGGVAIGASRTAIKLSGAADTAIAAQALAATEIPIKASNDETVSLKWYIGPNDYKVLRTYNTGMEEMVPVGYGIMAFVKYINKFTLIPIFYFLSSFISNYVVIIVIMTILIRLVLSFFTYKSYLSSAKMRVLKPELDELRAKYGDDQQKFGVEQMKLYKSAGVNMLGGCLPMLFQFPFLIALYYLFPSFIEFRQQHFLWANDLSTYDSILNLPFAIPFYGNHVSLFTLLMTASSLFLALYNRNMTPQQDPNNQMLKYMPYIMPVVFLGIFNNMAAALTFYYTFSNLISIAQQFIIQKYFIDEKAIHAQLQANKNKPVAPSKWAQKLEEIQKAQAEKMKQQPRVKK